MKPTFADITQELLHERKSQSVKWWHTYSITDHIDGGMPVVPTTPATVPPTRSFIITIEQGTDFQCEYMTATSIAIGARNGSTYPSPNATNILRWACRGMRFLLSDKKSSRTFMNDFVPFELFATCGYGNEYIRPFPFNYFFPRGTKLQLDVRNYDNDLRSETDGESHQFTVALHGYKYLTSASA